MLAVGEKRKSGSGSKKLVETFRGDEMRLSSRAILWNPTARSIPLAADIRETGASQLDEADDCFWPGQRSRDRAPCLASEFTAVLGGVSGCRVALGTDWRCAWPRRAHRLASSAPALAPLRAA